jgi:transposase
MRGGQEGLPKLSVCSVVAQVAALKAQLNLPGRALAMRFRGMFRSRECSKLDIWIDDAICSELAPIVRFARVLRRDIDAVRNAVELPWSNGQAEGQINRLKAIKRAMYGRAGADLVRARMLPFKNADPHTN